jgi:hypothetical protein
MNDNVICIIGMHRSGTSMVARFLGLGGLNLGPKEQLVGPTADNPMGHFEHAGFLEINDALLKYFGGSWDNPPSLKPGWEQDPTVQDIVEKAQALMDTLSGSNPWGWKEPRTTLLLPFWKRLLPNLRYIICIRNPLEVARSLEKRDGISIAAAVQLWSEYTRAAIQSTKDHPRILTFYQDYFSNPLDELNRVAAFCGLETMDDLSRVRETVSDELRHQNTGPVELLNESSIPLEYKYLYLGLRVLRLEELGEMQSVYGTRERTVEDFASVLTSIDNLHDRGRLVQLEIELSQKELQLSALRARMRDELREQREQISKLQDDNARLQGFADAVQRTWAYRFYKTLLTPFNSR